MAGLTANGSHCLAVTMPLNEGTLNRRDAMDAETDESRPLLCTT
jgi:hypothetical protein